MSRAVVWASALRDATRGLAARSGRSHRRRRRLIAYGLSLATVGTIGVLLAMSSGDRTAGGPAAASIVTVPTPTASSKSSAGGPSSGTPEPAASPVPSVIPIGEADAGADLDAALDADDPLAAGRILVDLREACLDGSDPECVGQVDEPGSAIEVADRLMLAGATPSGAPRTVVDASSLRLIGAQGDAAMLGADVVPESAPAGTTERQPVTILVMRTETGWRLREVFSA
ncbi:hypothetical protein ACL9RL_15330 [Plantibacter sp. Mn2098]|uniref:hypothetical protein n=1 Tax=Plantibacter sp. Mn2098 TaxID=3395266 RepID=UPI003BC829C1